MQNEATQAVGIKAEATRYIHWLKAVASGESYSGQRADLENGLLGLIFREVGFNRPCGRTQCYDCSMCKAS